jgi:hypothetical protein
MRKEQRVTVGRPGRIDLGEDRFIACRICNISPGGALLLVENSELLPATFALTDVFATTKRRVRIAWRGGDHIGVRFLDPLAPKPAVLTFGKR